jgi:murein DD-endopeptidase MepM/ murein hydrolase activator NlpD
MTLDDDAPPPTIIQGSGKSKGAPFVARRKRSLSMRLVIIAVLACVLVAGLFTVTPLGIGAVGSTSPLAALAGKLASNGQVGYQWYTVQWGDTPESIAAKFHVQVGGIYELNHLYAGQELALGQPLEIPTDQHYGASYVPPSLPLATSGARYGSNWWNSIAGQPQLETPCAPNGNGVPTAYQLQPPDWGAVWVRGFIVWPNGYIYHTGVDLAAPYGNPIRAAQAGQVIWSGYDATNGLGWSIKIDNCNGVSTVYGHMAKVLVGVRATVQAGQEIGLEGSTGNSTGPHLHFMVEWNNDYRDPMAYYGYSQCTITKNPSYC